MSESANKENRRRKLSKIVEPNTTSNKKKRKLLKLSNGLSGINLSKQLSKKRNQSKVKKAYTTRTCINQDSRLCGNGKPMPSLKELEKLYDDSEEDANNEPLRKTNSPLKQSTGNDLISMSQNPDHCQKLPNLCDDNIFSPTTIKECAIKMMQYLEEVMEYVVVKDDDDSPPPVIPQKKVKKSDIPYIDGCKERSQVEWRPQNNFCKGDGDYGVKPYATLSSDDELPSVNLRQSKKRTTISNSIFNLKSAEISKQLQLAEQRAEMLKSMLKTDDKEILATNTKDSMQNVLSKLVDQEPETIDNLTSEQYNKKDTIDEVVILSDDSNDSVKTVYYFNKSECEFKNFRAFSPKPSTSLDQETILENDKNFEESLILQAKYLATKNKDSASRSLKVHDNHKNNDHDKLKDPFSFGDNSINNDIYSSIEMSFPIQVDEEDYDDDYDKLLAENKAIIQKYKQSSSHERLPSSSNNQIITSKAQDSANNQLINTIPQNDCIIITDSHNSILNNTQGAIKNFDNATNLGIQRQPTTETYNSNFISESLNTATLSCQIRSLSRSCSSNQLQSSIINNSTSSFKNLLPSANNSISSTLNNVSPVLHTTRKRPRKNKTISNNKKSSCASNCLINTRNDQPPSLNNNVSLPNEISHTPSKDQNPPAATGSMRNIGDCPICMESLCEKQVASTLCGHVFCLPCIKEALRTWGKKCPSCRKSFRGKGYHQLFL